MMKKYMIDFLFAALFLVVFPLFVVGKPEINIKANKVEMLEVGKQEGLFVSDINSKRDYSNIEGRNIFSADGSYTSNVGKKKKKYEAYRFVGVIISGQKSAVFIMENDNIVALKIGEKLDDGFIVTSIDDLSVKLEKDGKIVEHRIFKLGDVKQENEMDTHRKDYTKQPKKRKKKEKKEKKRKNKKKKRKNKK